jgi:hypothetical protein
MLCRYSLQVIKRKLLIRRSYLTCESKERVSIKLPLYLFFFIWSLVLMALRRASCPPQNHHYVPRHINNRYINSYYRLPVFQRVTPKSLFFKGGDFLPVFCRYYNVPICTASASEFCSCFPVVLKCQLYPFRLRT